MSHARHLNDDELLAELQGGPAIDLHEPMHPEVAGALEERLREALEHPERVVPSDQVLARAMATVESARRRGR